MNRNTDTPKVNGDVPRQAAIRAISLWQPWASWVSLGWKTIETRTHAKFRSLKGQRIVIHAALKWDNNALAAAAEYLTEDQIKQTERFLRISGALICSVLVDDFRLLTPEDSKAALMECKTERFGLFLKDIVRFPAVPMRGRQGIWTVLGSEDCVQSANVDTQIP